MFWEINFVRYDLYCFSVEIENARMHNTKGYYCFMKYLVQMCVCVCVCMWAHMCVTVSPLFEIFSAYILSFLLNQREEERLHGVNNHLSSLKITKMCVTLVDNCDFLQKWFHALFYFKPRGLQDLRSPTRDQTYALGSEGRVLTYGLPGNSPEVILN